MMANKPTNRTMSEVMLHGVLNMPPELWNNDSPIDVAQRHSRYVEASKRIYELEEQLQQAHDYADRLVEHKDMVCLPADLANLRAANAHFAIENHDLKERCDKLEQQLAEHKLALQTGDAHCNEMFINLEKTREERDELIEAIVIHRSKAFPLTGEQFDQELWDKVNIIRGDKDE